MRWVVRRINQMSKFPKVKDPKLIGTYDALSKSGGGYVWDDVLEYRVWVHPLIEDPDTEESEDFYYVFETYEEALEVSESTVGAEEPLALILQEEYIDESKDGIYIHVKEHRVTEWPVEFLSRPRRTELTIPEFLSPNAPKNRLEILRGQA